MLIELHQCSTENMMPISNDNYYYYLPINEKKPCLYLSCEYESSHRRLYNSNVISHIKVKLDEGLKSLNEFLRLEEIDQCEKQLQKILEELGNACSRYLTLTQTKIFQTGARNKLDKERLKFCQQELDVIGSSVRQLRTTSMVKGDLKDRVQQLIHISEKLGILFEDPQHSVPDIFVWIINGNKRLAYHRISTCDLIFSPTAEESGKLCASLQSFFLKIPGKKPEFQWNVQAQVRMFFWFGLSKYKKEILSSLPIGYDLFAFGNCLTSNEPIPKHLHYMENHSFQLRAHLYQARNLIGLDETGLSDPFARVVFGIHTNKTQVIDETLNPSWDEMLLFREVCMNLSVSAIKKEPPLVVIEIFDDDKGKSEFIGRVLASPLVKECGEKYVRPKYPPKLQWYNIWRGNEMSGQLLAAFELLQLASHLGVDDLPPCELPVSDGKHKDSLILPVPNGIRPNLSKYRIEILFWGMRDMKKIQFMNVDKPRIDIECSGKIISSSVIQNSKKFPNFTDPIQYFDIDLPDNDIYCPPIAIRCVDCRNFGRFQLVGSHVIENIRKFILTSFNKHLNEEYITNRNSRDWDTSSHISASSNTTSVDSKKNRTKNESLKNSDIIRNFSILKNKVNIPIENINETVNNRMNINKYTINIYLKNYAKIFLKPKIPAKKRKGSAAEEEEDGESFDWWTKYHASMDAMDIENKMKLSKDQSNNHLNNCENKRPHSRQINDNNINRILVNVNDNERVSPLRVATVIAAKLSPKSQRIENNEEFLPITFKIYNCELESAFGEFKEWLHSFNLYRGKKNFDCDDDESRVVGKFKGGLIIYKLPLDPEFESGMINLKGVLEVFRPSASSSFNSLPENIKLPLTSRGIFKTLPQNEPIRVLVRIYVIKAIDLHPADLNGKADPYIVIKLGQNTINDKEHYISKQLNPVFGKFFELEACFPMDSTLRVQIYDWDLIGSDDMIGETIIDLENRYYSRHRATCGLAQKYDIEGFNAWRDPQRPTQILSKICRDYKLSQPLFKTNKCIIGEYTFLFIRDHETESHNDTVIEGLSDEELALGVLHNWQKYPIVGCDLVEEHIETRSLYNPDKQGLEQGKLEMWVDLFPLDLPPPGPPVDITPRRPKSYELRVIIWNTDDVVLEDDAFFTGEKMSDIYVKGWVKGNQDMQSTDIHYRSLTGEGNFNWRFIFSFEYLVAEEKVVISQKDTLFSWDETETKIPIRLNLQVWDADHFSADDFLGALTLDLNKFPRGAKSSKLCTLDMLKTDGSVPQMSLFKHKRVKGWWPFHRKNEGEEMELTGKVEAELQIFTSEDAEKHPAGFGRNEPDPLDKPSRPDTSFIWFLNPLKSLRYILWNNYRWLILKIIIIIMLTILIALFIYSTPGYLVKKLLRV